MTLTSCPKHEPGSAKPMPGHMPHDARTYGRTYVQQLTLSSYVPLSNTRRGAEQKFQLAREYTRPSDATRALKPLLGPRGPERFPVLRSNADASRAPISNEDRLFVYARDNFQCVWCASPYDLTLDHFQPWSAYGPDDIDNLRTLCRSCNSYRSNFAHPADLLWRPIPHGYACLNCCEPNDFPGDLLPTFCFWCREKALGWPVHRDTELA